MFTASLVVTFCLTGVGIGFHKIIKFWKINLSFNERIIGSLLISSGILSHNIWINRKQVPFFCVGLSLCN